MRSEHERHQFSVFDDAGTQDGSRHQNYHCHPEYRGLRSPSLQGRLMQSTHGWFAVCPSFDLGDVRTALNERTDYDGVLTDDVRDKVRSARRDLLAQLDAAAVALPGDPFIAGQRVRFLVDQWEFDAALQVARDCRAVAWWCSALAGYVHASRNEVVRADSAFAAALAAMPPAEHCAWNDHHLVIAFESRDKYSDASCDKRDALNDRIWWLADPLFIEPGNERRVEQYVRLVVLALRTAARAGRTLQLGSGHRQRRTALDDRAIWLAGVCVLGRPDPGSLPHRLSRRESQPAKRAVYHVRVLRIARAHDPRVAGDRRPLPCAAHGLGADEIRRERLRPQAHGRCAAATAVCGTRAGAGPIAAVVLVAH